MNNFLAIPFKFNTHGFLKMSLITLALSLPLGAYTQAHAQPANEGEAEVLSIPPQEAFYIEETQATSNGADSGSQGENTLNHSDTLPPAPHILENSQNLAQTRNSQPSIDKAKQIVSNPVAQQTLIHSAR